MGLAAHPLTEKIAAAERMPQLCAAPSPDGMSAATGARAGVGSDNGGG